MHKFRTMRQGLPAELDTTTPFFRLDDDPRGDAGRAPVAKWSLDELPQLWNVVRVR
jgi:lipopolysaccharide/colanic/teichoic acid biosynthesis glycosyltransferase